MTTQLSQIKAVPLAGRIGAEIHGIHLSGELDSVVLDKIKQALNEYKVIFFKGQHHLDDTSQEAFSQLLGEIYAHPTVPKKENTNGIFELDSHSGAKANTWHTDVTFVPEVPKYSILRGVTIPETGGDTVWANTNAAYKDLPNELKRLADELFAIHSNEFDYANSSPTKPFSKSFRSTIFKTKHPVVYIHPETSEKHILLGAFAKKIDGYSSRESEYLISIFQSYITRLENTVRWKWNEGDVAIWDNLATQHYAIADYIERRTVRRVTVGKSIPINQKGESSTLLTKQ
ncbi:TauD/TfdA dioxygenase family protein [Priestia endophytica]|jgi:alpha-ketoglutarate-dependent sulfate ester dioxygenase|uniref:TauD/TfdA dioxygenase family protein n=1 Tax=Priestia endophytica TaxID=135735 RepID=UPI000DCA43DF|nr:TauD/TfdA family dioxygenase [Priestia endophytica]RAS85045.1 taurine dioxygenase [Priestia endophytica]